MTGGASCRSGREHRGRHRKAPQYQTRIGTISKRHFSVGRAVYKLLHSVEHRKDQRLASRDESCPGGETRFLCASLGLLKSNRPISSKLLSL